MQVQFAINTFFSAISVSILYISKDCEFCSFSHVHIIRAGGCLSEQNVLLHYPLEFILLSLKEHYFYPQCNYWVFHQVLLALLVCIHQFSFLHFCMFNKS